MKKFFFLLLISLNLYACKKEQSLSFKIHGSIQDESLHQPLENATVIIYEKAIGSSNLSEIGRTTTDENGDYQVEFPRNRVENYLVTIQKDRYFESSHTVLFSELDPKESKEYNFSTTAHSWVKIVLKNVDEVNSYDAFTYKKTKGKTDCTECCPNEEKIFYGALDTTFYCITDGGKPFAYYYQLSNTTFLGNNEKTTVPFDTITLVTEY